MQIKSSGGGLASVLWPEQNQRLLRAAALLVLGVVAITIAGKIKVPFYPVPMTLQTLAVMLVAAAYGMRLGGLTVLAYLVAGAAGLPVFANTPPVIAGPAYLLGPTGGFLLGFVALALIVGYAADRGWDRSSWPLFGAIILGDALVIALGFAWLAWFATLPGGAYGLGVNNALASGVAPFLLGDLVKSLLAALIVPAGWRLASPRI